MNDSPSPNPAIKLDAPILPNQGLGGLKLRTRLIDIQDLFIGLGITKAGSFNLVAPFDARYHLGNGEVTVAVDVRNGKVFGSDEKVMPPYPAA